MAEAKKAKVALEGYKHECELVEVVNNTAVIMLDGKRTMTSVDSVTATNAEAKKILGVMDEPKEEEHPKKKPAAKKSSPKK